MTKRFAEQGALAVSIERVLREPARFSVMAQLSSTETASFQSLLREARLTWGNLSFHVGKLTDAGYVEVSKEFRGKKTHTVARLTDEGRNAFERYCRSMGRPPGDLAVRKSVERNDAGPVGEDHAAGGSDAAARKPPGNIGQDRRAAILRGSHVFSGLPDDDLVALSNLAVEFRVQAGQFLYLEDEPLERVYIVGEGRVKVLRNFPSGRNVILAFFSRGDMFGNISMVSGKPPPASAQAVSDSVLLAFKHSYLLSFISQRPELSFKLLSRVLNVVGLQLLRATRRLTDMAVEKVDRRIARTLVTLSVEFGRVLPFTRREIAEISGTSTETAIRLVKSLEKGGILRPSKGKLIILDSVKLRAISDDVFSGQHPTRLARSWDL